RQRRGARRARGLAPRLLLFLELALERLLGFGAPARLLFAPPALGLGLAPLFLEPLALELGLAPRLLGALALFREAALFLLALAPRLLLPALALGLGLAPLFLEPLALELG